MRRAREGHGKVTQGIEGFGGKQEIKNGGACMERACLLLHNRSFGFRLVRISSHYQGSLSAGPGIKQHPDRCSWRNFRSVESHEWMLHIKSDQMASRHRSIGDGRWTRNVGNVSHSSICSNSRLGRVWPCPGNFDVPDVGIEMMGPWTESIPRMNPDPEPFPSSGASFLAVPP